MAKLVYGLMLSLDGYVDHKIQTDTLPNAATIGRFFDKVLLLTGAPEQVRRATGPTG